MKSDVIQVLLVEDNPEDVRSLRQWLEAVPSRQFVMTVATHVDEALDRLAGGEFDIVMTDLSLAGSDGLEAFRRLHAAAPTVPFVVLSSVDDETVAIGAVREGAQDYLVKNRLDPRLLDRSIRYAIERNRSEEQLVSSQAFYHSLVEHLPQNIFRKDLDERFTFANQRFCQLLGRPLEEIIGRTDFDFYPPALAAKYQQDDQYVIATGKTVDVTEENVAPNGEKMYVHVVKTPIRDAKGQVLGTQCIFWDETDRRRYEEQLQLKNAQLAQTAEALRRSHEELKAAQLQLIQAEKMESIGTLAAGVAHEVKNPLAILQMGLNYLGKKVPVDDNITMVLQEMRDAIQRADSITRGLLEFAASKQITMTPHDLNLVVADTLKMVRYELKNKRVTVCTEFGEGLPRVAVDRTQIQQVFVNLFVNAAHAMEDGGTLTVRTSQRQMTASTQSEGSRSADRIWVGEMAVVAEVEDTGPGIPEEYLAKIFDPFFTTKPTGVGTGLGLPVSKKIIELHGGTIGVRNKPDGGVRATVLLKPAKEQT